MQCALIVSHFSWTVTAALASTDAPLFAEAELTPACCVLNWTWQVTDTVSWGSIKLWPSGQSVSRRLRTGQLTARSSELACQSKLPTVSKKILRSRISVSLTASAFQSVSGTWSTWNWMSPFVLTIAEAWGNFQSKVTAFTSRFLFGHYQELGRENYRLCFNSNAETRLPLVWVSICMFNPDTKKKNI